MDKTRPERVRQYFQQASKGLHENVRIYVGGVIALIMQGYVSRRTEDIDVVGEVPPELRANYKLLEELHRSYALNLGHVQPHYYPKGWQDRAHSLEPFGHLQVFLLDVFDVFLSKLFSARQKDIDDLRVVAPQINKETLVRKLKSSAGPFLAVPDLKKNAEDNWQILFGESLPQ
jgi:hypothetical protein